MIDPRIAEIAYDDELSLEQRQEKLAAIYDAPETSEVDRAQIEGYAEMLQMMILAREPEEGGREELS